LLLIIWFSTLNPFPTIILLQINIFHDTITINLTIYHHLITNTMMTISPIIVLSHIDYTSISLSETAHAHLLVVVRIPVANVISPKFSFPLLRFPLHLIDHHDNNNISTINYTSWPRTRTPQILQIQPYTNSNTITSYVYLLRWYP
jgi:hypothetical protein